MDKYAAYTINEFLEDITDHLFEISTTATRLKETEGRAFKRATSKLLLLCKISRPDIYTAVALLTTRIKEPTNEYWKNLARVLAYLKGKPEEGLPLSM